MGDFRVLGDVEVWAGDVPVDIGSARPRCVLAVLLVDANRVVRTDQLVERVWGDRPPHTAKGTLASYLTRLRQAIGAPISRRSGGYVLEVDEDLVDLHRFRCLVALARDATDVAPLLEEALGLWRGEPFAGLDTPWLNVVRADLEAERRAAQLDLTDIRLSRGEHSALLPMLTRLAADHPLDERVAAQLMLAQYRGGRQSEALETYLRVRERLADELGIDPGPELRAVHQQVLSADTVPVEVVRPPVPRQLPPAPEAFSGRHRELDRLTASFEAGASATVITAVGGAGGIGKTWLVLRWAHENAAKFPDGQLYADLRGFDPAGEPVKPEVVLAGFLRALGLRSGEVPPVLEDRSALYRSLLADKRMLVVLDNARDAGQVAPLLPGGPGCAALVTSRNDLSDLVVRHGVRTLAVDYLDDEESYRLLSGMAGSPRVVAEPDAAAALVRYCGGLPLALGIVGARAARHPDFPLSALAEELSGELGSGIRTVFACSYRALEAAPARAFRLLGRAIGPDIGVAAASRLLDTPQARPLLTELERVHLVEQHRPGRYRMHDLIRLYARELTVQDSAAEDRLLDFYLETTLRSAGVARAVWLREEHENLAAAGDYAAATGRHRHAWQLANALWYFRYTRGHRREWTENLTRTLASARAAKDLWAEATATKNLGIALWYSCRITEGIVHYRRAAELYERLGDHVSLAGVFNNLGVATSRLGDDEQALTHYHRSVELLESSGGLGDHFGVLGNMAIVQAQLGDVQGALANCARVVELSREAGQLDSEGHAFSALGVVLRISGRPGESKVALGKALMALRAADDHAGVCEALNELGETLLANDERLDASEAHRQALVMARAMEIPYEQARAHAGIYRAEGAAQHWDLATQILAERGATQLVHQLGSSGPTG